VAVTPPGEKRGRRMESDCPQGCPTELLPDPASADREEACCMNEIASWPGVI
jgi:hypothetical protein